LSVTITSHSKISKGDEGIVFFGKSLGRRKITGGRYFTGKEGFGQRGRFCREEGDSNQKRKG